MFLTHLASQIPFGRHAIPFGKHAFRTGIRSASTVVGKSGRMYTQGDEMFSRHFNNPRHGVFKAKSGDESFILKRVEQPCYDFNLRLATEFAGSRRLRMHIDHNEEESLLVYPYSRGTLSDLIKEDPELPADKGQNIMRYVGQAIQELHSKDWIHLDIKPDNIFVNWTCDGEGNKTITDAALGDFDVAFKTVGKPHQTPYPVGSIMWRSPEQQTGWGMTKASDIFSYALVMLYTYGAGDMLLLKDYKDLQEQGINPQQELVARHFVYFGPVSKGLLEQVGDEKWRDMLKEASCMAQDALEDQPEGTFEYWGKQLGREAHDMMTRMTNPDPAARITIDQVMEHESWDH